jgi:hypothetical protein
VRDSPCRNLLSPQQLRQKKVLMSHRTSWETPRGRYDEHISKFSLSMKPRFNQPVGERNHFRRLLLANFGNGARRSLWWRGVCASSNMEPIHNTTKIFCPNLQWGCQSHRFADNKGLNVSCGPRWTTHASLRRLAWWWRRPPVMIPLSGRLPGRASGPSRSRDDDGGDLQYVSWKSVRLFRVFLSKGIYKQTGDVRRWTRWSHHLVPWPGVACTTLWCGCPLVHLRLSSGLRLRVR